jgi:polysaccharide export outer membrane protein
MTYKNLLLIILFFIVVVSCRSPKKVLYFQNIDAVKEQEIVKYEIKIQPDDLLYIYVDALDQETVAAFNRRSGAGATNITNLEEKGYLVDQEGYIIYPVLGKLKVVGYTRTQLIDFLKKELEAYVKNPDIKVSILNFKVTVLGEVRRPGVYDFNTQRVTLPDVIAKAGDISYTSVRTNIIVVREIDGKKTFNKVDFTQADIVNSPFYYMVQNDIVYVEPNKNKIDQGAIPTALLNVIAVFTLLATTYLLIIALD